MFTKQMMKVITLVNNKKKNHSKTETHKEINENFVCEKSKLKQIIQQMSSLTKQTGGNRDKLVM